MTTQRIVLPYLRSSPIHIPRRDLVLGAADSMALEVAIVQYDNPSAPALDLTGGIGGPTLTLFIWPASWWPRSWDYGAPCMTPGSPLWSGDGTISVCGPGMFDIVFPPGTMAAFPPRCGWSMQLGWDHSAQVSQLAWGNLHVMTSGQRLMTPPTAITTSTGTSIATPDMLVA
jgi:hypothetical protein